MGSLNPMIYLYKCIIIKNFLYIAKPVFYALFFDFSISNICIRKYEESFIQKVVITFGYRYTVNK